MKEMKIQKEKLVIRKELILFLILISIFNCTNVNQETSLLKVYFEDYKKENNIDSIFLAYDNNNLENLKSYKRYLNLKKESKDSLKNIIFKKEEYTNFNSQATELGTIWEIEFSKFKNVFSEKKANKETPILYVTKPIFTKDKLYALLYSYNMLKSDSIFFVPRMEVYKREKNTWKKIGDLSHHEARLPAYLQ